MVCPPVPIWVPANTVRVGGTSEREVKATQRQRGMEGCLTVEGRSHLTGQHRDSLGKNPHPHSLPTSDLLTQLHTCKRYVDVF